MDANVIGFTGNDPSDHNWLKASEIMCRVLNNPHKLVLDHKRGNDETILDEYQRQMIRSEFARKWLEALKQKTGDKVVFRYRAYGFHIDALTDPDDEKYVQVAVNSPSKIIISEDGDLTRITNDLQVVNSGIKIWDFDSSLNNL